MKTLIYFQSKFNLMNRNSNDSHKFITFEQPIVMVLREKEELELYYNSKYETILRVLRDSPLTVSEITERYNVISDKKRKEGTIYLFLKDLEKGGLIVQSGQHVSLKKKEGKTVYSRTLYSRAAKLIFPSVLQSDHWKTKKRMRILGNANDLFSLYTKGQQSSLECLSDLVYEIYTNADLKIAEFFEDFSKDVFKIIGDKPFQELDSIMTILRLLMIILDPSVYENQLKKCIESDSK